MCHIQFQAARDYLDIPNGVLQREFKKQLQ
jgi:hypothetical protein